MWFFFFLQFPNDWLDFTGGSDGKAYAYNAETRVWSLGRRDPLEKGMATHSSTLAWKIPWIEEPGRLLSMGLQRVRHDWATKLSNDWLKTQHSKNYDHGIWSHHFMADRQGNKENSDRLFLGSKITADGDCSHGIKRRLLLGRKAMTNLDSILKSRDITLPTKVCLVKAMVFPMVMYECESWITKKAEH